MVEVAKRYQDDIKEIKGNVENSYEYFKSNYERYHEFRKFAFISTLSDSDINVLKQLNKPQLDFNIVGAYLARLCGEFSKQEPSIEVSADYNAQVDPNLIQLVEGHFRHLEDQARNDGVATEVYEDQTSGGFSVFKVWTEYAHEMSMDQVIKWGRVYDPTLCGFDPLAKLSHKGDGEYCFEMYPMRKEEFKEKYPDVNIDNVRFSRNMEGFNWAYKNEKDDILLFVEYYGKKRKKIKLLQLADGQTMTNEEYDKFIKTWESQKIEVPPAIINERTSTLETICRYRLIEDQVVEYKETNFPFLPLIFVKGKKVLSRDSVNGSIQEYQLPYIYNAKGAQKLKTFAGNTLVNELENMVMHKFKVAKESIPPEYLDAYENIQQASTLIYNAYKDNDPTIPVPPPQEIARVPAPPEVMSSFAMADQLTQTILGSYDAALGINDNQLSGVAIVEGATQSNSAAMPYVVSYMEALNRVAQLVIRLIPEYYVSPRSLPVIGKNGKRTNATVNAPGQMKLKYDPNALQIKVGAGVNFAIQKNRALNQIIAMAQAMPVFAQFANEPGFLEVLLDNFEIRGVDKLKMLAQQYNQKLMMQQQQQQGMPNPMMMKLQNEQAEIQRKARKDQVDATIEAANLQLKQQALQNDQTELTLNAHQAHIDSLVQVDKHQAEKQRAAVDMAISAADMSHRHAHDVLSMHHRHGLESDELQHKVANTILQHVSRETSNIPQQGSEDNL